MEYLVVCNKNFQVLNIVHWDGEADYMPSYPDCVLYPFEQGVEIGHFRQYDGSYSTRDLAEEKQKLRKAVDAQMTYVFSLGYSPITGPLLGHTLQCRDTEDRTNWLTSQTSYMAAVQMGYGSLPGAAFRTKANETVTLTYQQGLEVLTMGLAVWGKNVMARSWELKDMIAAATTLEQLDAIDIETGWPHS